MANFLVAYNRTLIFEGGYVNDIDDAGGETYKGIARKFNPQWEGWSIVDAQKNVPDFTKYLDVDEHLQMLVAAYYKQHYWNKFSGDDINHQSIADELFDIGVNMGVHRAVAFLQRGLSVLNRNQKLYPDLVEDGIIGPKTLYSLKTYLKGDDPNILHKVLVVLRGAHYLDYMKRSPKQEKFARGWLSRLNFNIA